MLVRLNMDPKEKQTKSTTHRSHTRNTYSLFRRYTVYDQIVIVLLVTLMLDPLFCVKARKGNFYDNFYWC